MPHIMVGSQNPVKMQAALLAFQRVFRDLPQDAWTLTSVTVPSGVADQPMGDGETLRGARNRAEAARLAYPDADYWIGQEGGCANENGVMTCFAWMVVISHEGQVGQACTARFQLPEEVATLVRGGMELGHADDMVFGRHNSKQGDGSVGLLTGGAINRTEYYVHALICALVPFRNPSLTFPAVAL